MFRYCSFIVLLALVLLATSAIVLACAPAPTPVPATEANKALVRRYYEQVLNMGNLTALDELRRNRNTR